ncbi:hypothetical protein GLAREA_02670 [Glarea lozoyensis ATCC 20868]|uniref:Uncharacterized protein n=1 Tax=Glarea lozoyensis (strain ATCC 20868 / MF5171) TaxID=1116229 RepID=S3D3Y3_GLAL2|nr:uncharacterized protein GLAREA_02670 [Glarea lozoyensis ATCC 20868]EPE26756.1 hypothetical protein GLAREA_02670 [Glarea lozoyensis ATCC 20868]
MRPSSVIAALAFASGAVAELYNLTITAAHPTKVIAIESYFSDYDHHTLGVNATVGAIIGAVFASAAAYPTPAGALIDFRNRINYIAGPTPFLVDFENPAAVISSISAIMPTITPFPQALEIISSVYDYLGSVAYSELNNLTSLPYNISHSLGTFVPPEETPAPTTGPTSLPVTTTKPPVDTTAGPVCVPYTTTKKPGKWCRWSEKKSGKYECWNF